MHRMKCLPTQPPDDIDVPRLREKYRLEADRRRRPDGNAQYQATSGEFIDFYERDPHSPPIVRDPVAEDSDVVILGAGFSGLLIGARLKQAGITDVRIIEMGGDVGGTWYWNRYPGAQCDVESYTYLPLLEELNYVPKEKYSHGPEIHEYCVRIAKHFGLFERALFGTIIRELRWDNSIRRWRITTNRGDEIRARFFVMGPGPLNKPKLPGVPGIDRFKGHSFHTSRWDYDYTGGGSAGGLLKLGDKRVAIIGTGATAVQIVPHVGRDAKHLYVFQRTPCYVDERGNGPTDTKWMKSLKPGWQAERQRSFLLGSMERYAPGDRDLVCDGWTEINRNVQAKLAAMGNPDLPMDKWMEIREVEDYRVMERLRRRLESIVNDKKTAEALKPYYRWLCKRPCFNDDYLPTFNRPNVTLVDVSGSKGVEGISETGIIAEGTAYEVDCIIYASGFEVTDDRKRRFAIDVIEGRDGLSLYDYWADGYKTLHGMTAHGFPNFFFIGYSQGAATGSVTTGLEMQAKHIAYIVKEASARGATTVEPSQRAQDEWVRMSREKLFIDQQFWQLCTPSFYNHEGEALSSYPVFGEPYWAGFYAFDQLMKEWRDKGDLQGLVLGT